MVVPVLSWLSNAKDASYMLLRDITGAYAVDNTGGYGAPNAASPTLIGIRARYWADTAPYGHLVSEDGTLIAALLGSGGYSLTPADLGSTADGFSSGVHHLKYYPLETKDVTVTLTNGSKLVTVTAGADTPNTWNTGYAGIVFTDGSTQGTKVYLIDRAESVLAGSFYLTEAWEGSDVTGYTAAIGPEADLKVLMVEPAQQCVVARIGKLAASCGCNTEEEDKLINFTMMLFAAQINFSCSDFQSAHNKLVAVDLECNNCKQSCSCS